MKRFLRKFFKQETDTVLVDNMDMVSCDRCGGFIPEVLNRCPICEYFRISPEYPGTENMHTPEEGQGPLCKACQGPLGYVQRYKGWFCLNNSCDFYNFKEARGKQ